MESLQDIAALIYTTIPHKVLIFTSVKYVGSSINTDYSAIVYIILEIIFCFICNDMLFITLVQKIQNVFYYRFVAH